MILPSVYQFLAARNVCSAIYPEFLPQTHSLPAIMLELDGDNDEQMLDGSQSSQHQALVTVNCYADTILSANATAAAVKNAMLSYFGPFGDVTATMIYKESETSAPETDAGLRGVSLTFLIGYVP